MSGTKSSWLLSTLLLAAAATQADEPATFQWRFQPPPGSRYQLKTYTKRWMTSQSKAVGRSSSLPRKETHKNTSNCTQLWEFQNPDPAGNTLAKVTFQSLDLVREPAFDDKPGEGSPIRLSLSWARLDLTRFPLTARISPRGEVLEVKGESALVDAVKLRYPETDSDLPHLVLMACHKRQLQRDLFQGIQLPNRPLEPGQAYNYSPLRRNRPTDPYVLVTFLRHEDNFALFRRTVHVALDYINSRYSGFSTDYAELNVEKSSGLISNYVESGRNHLLYSERLPNHNNPVPFERWSKSESHSTMTPLAN